MREREREIMSIASHEGRPVTTGDGNQLLSSCISLDKEGKLTREGVCWKGS